MLNCLLEQRVYFCQVLSLRHSDKVGEGSVEVHSSAMLPEAWGSQQHIQTENWKRTAVSIYIVSLLFCFRNAS